MNCHLENNIRQINHTSLICFAMLEKNRINRNFGFLLSVFGFYRLCQYRLRFRLLKKPRFSVSVSVTDPALIQSKMLGMSFGMNLSISHFTKSCESVLLRIVWYSLLNCSV